MRATIFDRIPAGNGRRISLFGVVLLVLSHCASTPDVGGVAETVVDVDAELLIHFHDAALFCDRRIFSAIPLSISGATMVGDAALAEYAQWRPAGTPSISTGPHAGEAVGAAPAATNACDLPVSVAIGQMYSQIQDGFCRADFNYCLGMERELHAQSLPGGSAQSALKAAILRRARERLQAAGLEYVSSLAFYERACISEPSAPLAEYAWECNRLAPAGAYLPAAHDRLLESVAQTASLAQMEAGLRVDVGDRTLRETPFENPSEAIPALFGPAGARTAAVSALYGPPDDVTFEDRWNVRRYVPVALPLYAPSDERAAQTLELMRRYRVPTVFGRSSSGGPIQLVDSAGFVAIGYRLLDDRMAAERYLAPYDEVEPADPLTDVGTILRSRRALEWTEAYEIITRPTVPHESLLAIEHQVSGQDVTNALLLAADVYETQFGRFVFEPQLYDDGGSSTDGAHYLGLVHATASPRPVRMLASAFSDELGPLSADAMLPLLAPLPRNGSGAPPGDWYAWDLRRVDGSQSQVVADDVMAPLGAAGALHLLRVHLLRLASLESTFVDTDKTSEALDLIEHAVGAVWTEYDEMSEPDCASDRDAQPLYAPCGSCSCDLVSPPADGTHWDLYYPSELEEAYVGGAPVVAYWVDDVRCLVQQRRPGTDEPCTLAPPQLTLATGPVGTRIGRARRTYVLPAPPTSATHHYVMWRSAEGHHRLLDVIPVTHGVGVHPLGGVFLDGAASAWSYDPWRPARPSISASGSPRDLVPPLESELISDGDDYEDSFARYLADARAAVTLASAQLAQARDEELLARQNELSTRARLDEAAVVETGDLADMCGDLPGCVVARADPLTLRDLNIVGDPPPPPNLGEYADCDAVLDGIFSDFTARISSGFVDDDDVESEAQAFVRDHMTRVLGCTLHIYLTELAALRIEGLPVAVRDALASGGSGEFTTHSGEVREHLISLFQALDGARSDVRRLASHRLAAETLIDTAAAQISYANVDQLERDLCVWDFALGVAGDVISIATSIYGAGQSFSSASTNFGAATRFADTDPKSADALYVRGIGGVRSGTQDLGDAASRGGTLAHRVQGFVASDGCMAQDGATTAGFRSAQQLVASLQTVAFLARSARDQSRSTFFGISAIDGLERRAQLANRRHEVARMQAESDSLADLPEWHSLRSFRQRRAESALRRAQHATFVARRAIEFRLGVDLSSMHQPEPLTPPPSTWADSLFDVGAVVLALPEDDTEVSIGAEELSLYLERLQRFVDGYPIARRFRDAGDVQVLDIGAMLYADPTSRITEQMSFKCSGHPVALPGGRLPGSQPTTEPCAGLGDVEYAEIAFSIPAELDAYLADRLAAGSFNYRHELLAPNFIGVAVLDCEQAFDPAECYSDGNVPYTLRHMGPFVVESFDRELHTFFMEPGVIAGGRALVAERSFTTPLSGADRSLVTPFFRQELRGRPLSGLYTLRVEGRPEVRWAHLERIQLLLGYRYWTRQE